MVKKVEIGANYNLGYYSSVNSLYKLYCLETVVLPSNHSGNLPQNFFQNDVSLKAVVLPKNTLEIGQYAFNYACSATKISLNQAVNKIGASAFQSAFSVERISIPQGVKALPEYIFQNCYKMKHLIIPDEVISLGMYSIHHADSLEKVIIPDTVTSISNYALGSSINLKYVKTPMLGSNMFANAWSGFELELTKDITTIPNNAFSSTHIKSIRSDTVTSIGDYAFQNSQIENAIFPNCTSVSNFAFQYCYNLKNLVVNQNCEFNQSSTNTTYNLGHLIQGTEITEIKQGAFSQTGFNSITFLGNITNIGSQAFASNSLTEIKMLNNTVVPTLASDSLTSAYSAKIIVPKNLYNTWITATNWTKQAAKIFYIDDDGNYSQEEV